MPAVAKKPAAKRTTKAKEPAATKTSKLVPVAEDAPPTATPTQKAIQKAFTSAQNSTATHRKLVVTIRSLQEECENSGTEKEFNRAFARCLNRVLVVKKGEVVGDRVMRFCDVFIRHIHEKELRERKVATKVAQTDGDVDMDVDMEDDDEEEEEVEPTVTTRFTTFLLRNLLHGLKAANKIVRFRVCQFLALTLNSIAAVDEKVFAGLKDGLVARMMDREPAVRVQASLALMKLGFGAMEEDESDSDEDEDDIGYVTGGVVGRLVDRLSSDTSADVRRAVLLNLNHTPLTLPHLLERSRDIDPLTRRLVYSRTLPSLGDFRLLSISMREKILRWGLQDRDQNVRKAAEKTFAEGWVENANGDLLEVLERLDVINSKVAEMALESFWKQGTGTEVEFNAAFWEDLTAESVFMARTFNDYCRHPDTPFDHHIDDKIPEVTFLAFIVQKYTNLLVASPAGVPVNSQSKAEYHQDASEVEFIVEQLLLIALKLDYSDEIGRRKMFALLRECLSNIELPEATVSRVVEVLRKVSGGEREFCSVVLEIIAEVHDIIAPMDDEDNETTDGNDSFHSAQSDLEDAVPKRKSKKKVAIDSDEEMEDDEDSDEKAIKEMVTNLRCLFIAQCMLENVEGDWNSNAHLTTMLNGLIVPAVRSQEAPIRERGLRCLGLCCLLDKPLAEENFAVFAHCFNKGHEELQIEAAHIMCDILVSHGATIFDSEICGIEQEKLFKMLIKATKLDDSPEVQATVIEVLCKLMLARVVEDEELLKAMVICYFDATTADNLTLRQTLSYFLPVYAHSRNENQILMARITVSALHSLMSMYATMDEGEEMVAPNVIANQFADWTDPRKVFAATQLGKEKVNHDVHVELAGEILARIGSGGNKEEKKVLCGMLSKLYITQHAAVEKLQELYEQVIGVIERKTVTDAVSRNAITKFESSLGKIVSIVEAALSGGNETTIAPSSDDGAATTAEDTSIASELGDLTLSSPVKKRTKKQIMQEEDDEEDEEEEGTEQEESVAEENEDEEEDDE